MSKPETTTAEILVHLARPGVETQDFQLPEGATVADLMKASGVATGQSILVDGVPIEEVVPLVEGAVVTMASPAVRTDKPWLTPIPAFQDEALYREYRECLEAHRRELISEEEPEA